MYKSDSLRASSLIMEYAPTSIQLKFYEGCTSVDNRNKVFYLLGHEQLLENFEKAISMAETSTASKDLISGLIKYSGNNDGLLVKALQHVYNAHRGNDVEVLKHAICATGLEKGNGISPQATELVYKLIRLVSAREVNVNDTMIHDRFVKRCFATWT